MNRCHRIAAQRKKGAGRHLFIWLIAMLPCSHAAAESGSQPPEIRPFTATYDIVAYKTNMGSATIRLSLPDKDRNVWLSETVIAPEGVGKALVDTMQSGARWRWHEGKIMLLESTKKEGGHQKEHYSFDYEKGHIIGSYRGRDVRHDIPDNTVLDLNTLFIKLLVDLRRGQDPSGEYLLISRGKIRAYQIYDRGEVHLRDKRHRYLEREKGDHVDERYWLNPDFRHLPTQIEKLKSGLPYLSIKAKKITQAK